MSDRKGWRIWRICLVHNDRGNPNFNNKSCWKATAGDSDYAPCEMVPMRLVSPDALVVDETEVTS